MPTPAYSATDIGAAVVVLVGFVLDVLTGYGWLPAIDPQSRTTLMASLTVLTVAGIAAYVRNRSVKHQAQAAVATAQVTAVPPAVAVPVMASQRLTGENLMNNPPPAP